MEHCMPFSVQSNMAFFFVLQHGPVTVSGQKSALAVGYPLYDPAYGASVYMHIEYVHEDADASVTSQVECIKGRILLNIDYSAIGR